MLKIIRNLLQSIINDIDCGNSNIDEKDALNIINIIKHYTDKTQKLSKYQACQKLNISRATFDNLVREGVIPRGQKVAGFKELFWVEKDLNNIMKSRYDNKKKNYNSNI